MMKDSIRLEIIEGMEILSSREADIVKLYYGLDGNKPLSLEEIGEMYDMSKERVRQIKEKSIRRMRRTLKKSLLKAISTI